jgi:hypothetical protein
MTFVLKDRIKVTSTTTGTGTFTLGAASTGYQDFSGIGNGNQTYYTITNGTAWEVGIGTYTSSGTTLSRDYVLASSNSGAKVDWAAGSKDVYVPQPAENTQGSAPTADNSSIGTDGVAFDNFQKNLQLSVNGGVTFKNGGVCGIVSTISSPYTLGGGQELALGGVLAPNGDIHFVPYIQNNAKGYKVSSTGVASTYALVYTGGYYAGGALSPNGDIHFVPYSAVRGQKVSINGVVSTYSLVYTTATAYIGGVLAPNGDIHFIPYSARRGQKISSAGVVSTYSLVYTTTFAYAGGVLAPNGDIHFVPHDAVVGQKISSAGVVSTYSLVYTAGSYRGGVISPSGEIHFIPYGASVGQKVSTAGVVSTYSILTNNFQGGVLSPDGSVYSFRASGGTLTGQRISTTGVVSTFSLTVSTLGQVKGAVLNANGEIYLVPSDADQILTRISTNPAIPFGIDTCLSSYLNKF